MPKVIDAYVQPMESTKAVKNIKILNIAKKIVKSQSTLVAEQIPNASQEKSHRQVTNPPEAATPGICWASNTLVRWCWGNGCRGLVDQSYHWAILVLYKWRNGFL